MRTFQHGARATTGGIQAALDCGARFLELDIYREATRPTTLFVAHGQERLPHDLITTTKLPLRDALSYIALHAFEHTTDPLFLALELNMHADASACQTLAEQIEAELGPRLYRNTLTEHTPLRELVGRVVLFAGGGSGECEALNRLLHVRWNEVFQNQSSVTPIPIRYTGCARIYPAGDVRGALSLNFNPVPYLDAGASFVAMNLCTNDAHTRAYVARFGRSSFLRK